ncbi:MAG TPA: hypothetical protein VM840_08780 [Actinomycetota bacterium]|nr:hypothetical protein [Actinomycetota bacterium]
MAVTEAVQLAPETRTRTRWTRLASLGLLVQGLAPVLMLTTATLWGMDMGEETGFFAAVAAIVLTCAFLVYRFGTWSKVVGIVGALVGAGTMFWTAFGLTHFPSFFDVLPGLMVIPGALIAIVSCVAAIVAGRRGHRSAEAVGGEAVAIRVFVAALALAALVTGTLTFAGRSSVADADTVIAAKDFAFEGPVRVEGGSKIVVRNDDPYFHTATVEAFGVDEGLTAGRSVEIRVPDRPGTYVLYCKPHTSDAKNPGEDDMATRLIVS